jgi:hypothetical protein
LWVVAVEIEIEEAAAVELSLDSEEDVGGK